MTIVSGDLIHASDFISLKSSIDSKCSEARRNNINISNIDFVLSHPISRTRNIHTENVNRIIRKFNELKNASFNKQDLSSIPEVVVGDIIQLSYNSFITIISNLNSLSFQVPIGELTIIGPSEVKENTSTRYELTKSVEGGTGNEQVTSGITWTVSGDGASLSTITSGGYLRTQNIQNPINIIITANINTDSGVKTVSKIVTIEKISNIVALNVIEVDTLPDKIYEGETYRFFCYAFLDNNQSILMSNVSWIVQPSSYASLTTSFMEEDYPEVSIAKVTGINISDEFKSVTVKASYSGIFGQRSILFFNVAEITNIYIINKQNNDVFVIAGTPTTFSVFGSYTDSTRQDILVPPSEILWEVSQDNNTGSYFEGNQFYPGVNVNADTPVTIIAKYQSPSGQQTASRVITIQSTKQVDRIVILQDGISQDDAATTVQTIEKYRLKFKCVVYFDDGSSVVDPTDYISWTIPNPASSVVNSGTAIGEKTGILTTGSFSQSATMNVKVNYRNTFSTRLVNIKTVDRYQIGDENGTLLQSKSIDEDQTWRAYFYAVCDDFSKVAIVSGVEWKLYSTSNNVINPPYININTNTGEINTSSVDHDMNLKIGAKWQNPYDGFQTLNYLTFIVRDLNYVTNIQILGSTNMNERETLELTARVTLDDGGIFTPQANDSNLVWSIHNYGQLTSSNCQISSSGILSIGSMTATQTSVQVKAIYVRGGITKTAYHTVSVREVSLMTSISISAPDVQDPGSQITLICNAVFDNDNNKTQNITSSPDLTWNKDSDTTQTSSLNGNILTLGLVRDKEVRIKAIYDDGEKNFTTYKTIKTTPPQLLDRIELYTPSNTTQLSSGESISIKCRGIYSNPTEIRDITSSINLSYNITNNVSINTLNDIQITGRGTSNIVLRNSSLDDAVGTVILTATSGGKNNTLSIDFVAKQVYRYEIFVQKDTNPNVGVNQIQKGSYHTLTVKIVYQDGTESWYDDPLVRFTSASSGPGSSILYHSPVRIADNATWNSFLQVGSSITVEVVDAKTSNGSVRTIPVV